MNKAEMQHHWDRYTGFVRDALAAEKASEFFTAVQLSERSWAHLEGAIRHTRKSDVTVSGLVGIEIVLSYAPLLFDADALDRLAAWCSENRRFLKSTVDPEIWTSGQGRI